MSFLQREAIVTPPLDMATISCWPYENPKPPLPIAKPLLRPLSTAYPAEDKVALAAMDEAEAREAEAVAAKATLAAARKELAIESKDTTKATRKERKTAAKSIPKPLVSPSTSPSASTETLAITPALATPALTETTSIGSSATSACAPSYTSIDQEVHDKATLKAAKRRAKREANREKRRVELQLQERRPQPQPWETALDEMVNPPSDKRAARASENSVATFKVPYDRQLLVDFDQPLPSTDFDLSHNVAAAIVEDLVEKWGGWSITFLDPSYRIFLTVNKDAAISYKVVEGVMDHVAVVFGDPVCDPLLLEHVILEFRQYCRSRRWRTAFVGVRSAVARIAETRRWTSVQFAVEQVVDPQDNPILDGTKGKRMAVAVKKLVKDGVLRQYNPADGVDEVLQAFLQGVYDECYAAKEATKGDTTAYSTKLRLFDLPRLMTYFYTVDAATVDAATGRPNGLAGLMLCSPGKYLLDPVVAAPNAPQHTTDFLTYAAMGYLRRRGITHMSFGLEPLREIGEINGLREAYHADTRLINAASFDAFGFAGKKMLHDKFHPDAGKREKLYLILGARNCITQVDGAVAICNATHLKMSPVMRRLIWLVQAKATGQAIEGMLTKLVKRGRLSSPPPPDPNQTSSTQPPPASPSSFVSIRPF